MRLSAFDLRLGLMLLALAAAALAVWGAAQSPDIFHQQWLAASLFWLALPVGAMPLAVLHALTRGTWGAGLMPTVRAVMATLPVPLIALGVVLLFGLSDLFAWAGPATELPEPGRHPLLALNVRFFTGRTVVCLVALLFVAGLLGAWRRGRPGPVAAAVAAILWLAAAALLVFDWLLSLAPTWHSLSLAFPVGAAWVVAAAALVALLGPGPEPGPGRGSRHAREGKALPRTSIAAVWGVAILLWMAFAVTQYQVIRLGPFPHDVDWYADRTTGPWREVGLAAVLAMAALPLVAMLSGAIRRSRGGLAVVAVPALAGHALLTYWLAMPTYHPAYVPLSWLLPAVWLSVGVPWGLLLMRSMRRAGRNDGSAAVPPLAEEERGPGSAVTSARP